MKLDSTRYHDEHYKFAQLSFDVAQAVDIINNQNVRLVELELLELQAFLPRHKLDKKYALTCENKDPLIAVTLNLPNIKGVIVIDGYHRIYRDFQNSHFKIKSYLLDEKQTQSLFELQNKQLDKRVYF